MTSRIVDVAGRQILDSRGNPTIEVEIVVASGAAGRAAVPSGASTGAFEAVELRDEDSAAWLGKGVGRAVRNVREEVAPALEGLDARDQRAVDAVLVELDGTPNKARLGANAILAVSLAFARATAVEEGVPLYRHFAASRGSPPTCLPRPTINLFSGGKHAGAQVPIQDVLVVPASARTIDEALVMTFADYRSAAELNGRQYAARPLIADEGGLVPPFHIAEAMLADAVEAIQLPGLQRGRHVALTVDVADGDHYDD